MDPGSTHVWGEQKKEGSGVGLVRRLGAVIRIKAQEGQPSFQCHLWAIV